MKIKINVDNGSISVARVASLAGGRLAGAVDAADKKYISCVCTDSRDVCPGAPFVAIAGERTDGHKYIGAAVLSGAAAVLVEKEPADVRDIPIPVIVTDATVPALSRIAAGFASGIKARRVAVTGSVGKTTTKEFIASVLSQGGSVYRTEGNRNSVIGMPLTMLATPPDAEYAVLEMGMSGFGEIEAMSLAARPDIAVITNIGSSHLEYLGTRENIAKASWRYARVLRRAVCSFLTATSPCSPTSERPTAAPSIFPHLEIRQRSITSRDSVTAATDANSISCPAGA